MKIYWSLVLANLLAVIYVEYGKCEEFAPIVQLGNGKVRGIVQLSDDGNKVYIFHGIRYGRAERFAKPKPEGSWSGIYDATKWKSACPQTHFDHPPFGNQKSQTTHMSEDCLFVSVFQPVNIPNNTSIPVMVYYHGGSFESGTIFTTLYDGRYLASRGVVVVTVNYRLGTFGYLYGATSSAPGNQGLWDQLLALRWVHDNIAKFGGDPSQITIFGESAGVFPVTAFVLSPLTKGLFQRGIIQSGAPTKLTANAVTKPLQRTKYLTKLLNCPTEHMNETLACLKKKTVDEILNAQKFVMSFGQLSGPILEDEILPIKDVVIALKSGKFNRDVDFMYGTTRDEGTYFVANLITEFNSNKTVLTIEAIRDYIRKIYSGNQFVNEIVDFYTKGLTNQTSQIELKRTVARAFADPSLTCSTILFGEAVAKAAPTKRHYAYRLTQPTKTMFPLGAGCPEWAGVCHGMDVVYLFGVEETKLHPEDYKLSKEMITAWTNFAKHGSPGKLGPNAVEWTQAIDEKDSFTSYMNLDSAKFEMVKDYFKESCNAFWQPKIFA